MANGFLTEAPASRPGDSTSQYSADFGIVQKFTCPDELVDEWRISRHFDIIYEGVA